MAVFLLAGCCVLHSHTDLHCSTVFLLKRLEVHGEKGEAAGQVGVGVLGVSASVRAIERVFSQTFLCWKQYPARLTRLHEGHTWSTRCSGANSCQPDTAQRGQVQAVLTAAARRPLRRGGRGCTTPEEERDHSHGHTHTNSGVWKHAGWNHCVTDLWIVPERCLGVHLCSGKRVFVALVQEVTHPDQSWRQKKTALSREHSTSRTQRTLFLP